MTSEPSPGVENKVRAWQDGHAFGTIAAFEWCIARARTEGSPGTAIVILAELERRYPTHHSREDTP